VRGKVLYHPRQDREDEYEVQLDSDADGSQYWMNWGRMSEVDGGGRPGQM
jgi:hypothetical protein